jgi:uncharacterized membrane protein HdeD (DUF308 family)
MKKYLKEIDTAGLILMLLGVVMYRFMGMQEGFIACGIGIVLWLAVVVYKAFRWQEFQKDNKQNIVMMLIIIALLLGSMLLAQ